MQKFRGVLNKLTASNSEILAKEFGSLELSDDELSKAAKLIWARAVEEPQYQILHVQLLKAKREVVPYVKTCFVSKGGEEDKKRIVNGTTFLCNLRSEGLISAADFSLALAVHLENDDPVAAEAICSVSPFKNIIPCQLMEKLTRHAQQIAEVSESMRLKFLVEEAFSNNQKIQCEKSESKPFEKIEKQRIPSACTVYLSNIDCCATEWELSAILRSFGDIMRVRMCGNPSQATQYAFVEFVNESSAKAALEKDGKCLLGKYALRWSTSKSVIQDSCPTDAIWGKKGRERACTFGLNSDATPSYTILRRSKLQQARA